MDPNNQNDNGNPAQDPSTGGMGGDMNPNPAPQGDTGSVPEPTAGVPEPAAGEPEMAPPPPATEEHSGGGDPTV